MSTYVEWDALANIVIVGLVVGAGLPALFALGVRALAGDGAKDESGQIRKIRVAAAVACFTVVVGAIITAIVYIAAGGH
ncbi:hypothetical protein [Demequina capsici]|uniref:Uncharacterized protein n=1 Tax=Demequina capsici TaxID=3075620 RepID=A0AA96J820_9MICO|nr:hypothetical protein [Demequina sp. OYTSA14]WNM24598.1 hypothetical protein RN606_00160 [Demequina sp. OYTSA14]